MLLQIHYLPNIGFKIGSKEIKWGATRDFVRETFSLEFNSNDGVIENSQFFDGDTSYDIAYKQDNYENFRANYNSDNCLKELEIFSNTNIVVGGVTITFERNVSDLIREFGKLNHHAIEINGGNFFIEDLKLTITSSASMGGEGDKLAYFYCGKDVSHVIDEINELNKRP